MTDRTRLVSVVQLALVLNHPALLYMGLILIWYFGFKKRRNESHYEGTCMLLIIPISIQVSKMLIVMPWNDYLLTMVQGVSRWQSNFRFVFVFIISKHHLILQQVPGVTIVSISWLKKCSLCEILCPIHIWHWMENKNHCFQKYK